MKSPTSLRFARSLVASVAGVAMLTLSACSSLLTPLGSDKYDCNRKENPASPYCHSFRSVADGTNMPMPDSRYDAAVRIADVDQLAGIAPTPATPDSSDASAHLERSTAEIIAAAGLAATRAPRQPGTSGPSDATPVRVAPLVQRTWVKRHVEQGDRLVGSTYLYKQISQGHWDGFVETSGGFDSGGAPLKPHFPPEDEPVGIRAATGAASKGATSLVSRVKSSLSQPGLATPAGEVVAPPIDGASMPQ
jgi:conjugal transfer pilus assembly protein TraV